MTHIRLLLAIIVTAVGYGALPSVAGDLMAPSDSASATPQDANAIGGQVAGAVAQEMLPVFYEGTWSLFARVPYYDVEGRLFAYAFVFSRTAADQDGAVEETGHRQGLPQSMAELNETLRRECEHIALLEASIEQMSASGMKSDAGAVEELSGLVLDLADARKALRRADLFATIMTGARDDMPPVLKCYRGLPTALVEQWNALQQARQSRRENPWQVRRFLYLDRISEGVEVASARDGGELGIASEEVLVIDAAQKRVRPLEELRQERQARLEALRKDGKGEDMVLSTKQKQDRRQEFKKAWQEYKRRWDEARATR